MQKQELTFIVQAYNPLSKAWTNLYFAGCGIRQREYTKAYTSARKVYEVMSKYGSKYRIIKKYIPFKPAKNAVQLKLTEGNI